MDAFTQWNIDLMHAIQEVGGLVGLFRAFTFLGNDQFYLLMLPFLFWCIDRAFGARITIIYLLSAFLNTSIKEIVRAPRPFELDPGVLLVDDPESINALGYGMPSGHAQLTSTVWAALALHVRKGWFWVAAGVLAFLVGFSRIYLGAHTPVQVVTGWGLGIVVFGLYALLYIPIELWLGGLSLGPQLGLAVVVPAVLLVLLPVPDMVAAMGVLMGMGVGLAVATRYVPTTNTGSLAQRAVRYLVGVLVLFAIYFGLSAVFPGEGETLYVPLRFARYALLGVWMSLGAPWLFARLRLTPALQPA